MAGSANPGYTSDMHQVPIPDNDIPGEQPVPMTDWAAPIPCAPNDLVDSLTGDSNAPGQPFVRVVSNEGQSDVSDPGAPGTTGTMQQMAEMMADMPDMPMPGMG